MGFVASRTRSSSSISSSSTCSRPAVSRITTSRPSLRAASSPSRAAATGSCGVQPVDGDLDLPPELLELLDRGRALEVAGDERRPLALLAQEERELRRRGRLARALEPREQDHRRRPPEREPRVARAHERGQLLVHDLHDLLAGREALRDVLAERALLDRGREVLRDLEVDVGLEQREADLAHRLRDRLLVEPAAAAEAAEGRLELVGERVEHGRHSVRARSCGWHVGAARLLHSFSMTGRDDPRRHLPSGHGDPALRGHRGLDAAAAGRSASATRAVQHAHARARPRGGRAHGGHEVDWAGDGVVPRLPRRARGRRRGRARSSARSPRETWPPTASRARADRDPHGRARAAATRATSASTSSAQPGSAPSRTAARSSSRSRRATSSATTPATGRVLPAAGAPPAEGHRRAASSSSSSSRRACPSLPAARARSAARRCPRSTTASSAGSATSPRSRRCSPARTSGS